MALVVITGGARSGKSAAAQRMAVARSRAGARVVVAVFGKADGDPEFAERIERHRTGRPEGFRTLEASDPRSWIEDVAEDELLVLECLGTLTALAMEEIGQTETEVASSDLLDSSLSEFVEWVVRRPGDTIVVTNEVGWGVVPSFASGRIFRDALGRANAALVTAADASYLAVNGRLLDLGCLPRDVQWPAD
ncbi:MAG: bifunctional adenosylcobinamide kinase/adenosylcobinamide-phosphate guanylyltransferase [Anaerosomatales bacterium]|nr:bifunctional adenosylcobinamide kinase/adenosylcobinamide-phosphate guanylyltransferase [Anaerosomatales bacterium]MDT8433480.1 bifunctional adenosylcobinamide kinase/adenosylcobinamide-phosphate guanylyltransferase [Anaerosomatales bacterium]